MSWLQNLIGHKLLQTKDFRVKANLRNLLNKYSNIPLETYLQVKESLRNIPKKLYIPAFTHILNTTKSSLPLMTRQEQRDKDLSCLYIAYHFPEINSKLTHLSSYTNPEVKKMKVMIQMSFPTQSSLSVQNTLTYISSFTMITLSFSQFVNITQLLTTDGLNDS